MSAPPPFAIHAVDTGDPVLVRVSGELDLHTAPDLDSALTTLHARHCELGLAQVPFTDSTAINLLTRHHRPASVPSAPATSATRRRSPACSATAFHIPGDMTHAADGTAAGTTGKTPFELLGEALDALVEAGLLPEDEHGRRGRGRQGGGRRWVTEAELVTSSGGSGGADCRAGLGEAAVHDQTAGRR
ncbi:STAS domain-containing protein [Streptomyces sp. VRA16 Mangrove soil]|uniref:STAS domain-containing protein n=1 Tax=Streptomyces sp. VRA16 Mangrove soil TaxID=2817434 RepID=UPI001A9E728E|nr:STAS domain-containing protein [Streptomyces sp. VRA16 Mangrove soil]MBO1332424.1 STAS domain-containing protein [Streptomyces sp. VRA16 Mangrove soil]